MKGLLSLFLAVLMSTAVFGQIQRWTYTYPHTYYDEAFSAAYGADNNIYCAGAIARNNNYSDFAVVSLTSNGGQRWIYRFTDPDNVNNLARSIAYGADGNIYAAGYTSASSTTGGRFTVASVSGTGAQRWVFRDSSGQAYQIVCGPDSNLYAAGYLRTTGGYWKYAIVSLTPAGSLRWRYAFDSASTNYHCAYTLVYGMDGHIYSGGRFAGGSEGYLMVISLTNTGALRWLDTISPGKANSIVCGVDGNIYATGNRSDSLVVVSLNDAGGQRWRYAGIRGMGYSIAAGNEANIYAAGEIGTGGAGDFYITSLDSAGTVRWPYSYNGPGNNEDWAASVVSGSDGNVYAAGRTAWGSTYYFTVISTDATGGQRWLYYYPNAGDLDCANSIVFGNDGNLYAAGRRYVAGNGYEFFVVSLDPQINSIEDDGGVAQGNIQLAAATFQKHSIAYRISSPAPMAITMSLYNILGGKIADWTNRVSRGVFRGYEDLGRLSPGIYFLRAEAENGDIDIKKIVIL